MLNYVLKSFIRLTFSGNLKPIYSTNKGQYYKTLQNRNAREKDTLQCKLVPLSLSVTLSGPGQRH